MANQLIERLAGEELHRDERVATVLADVENRDDVGMAEAPGGAGLAGKALAELRCVEAAAQQLDDDEAVDRGVAGKVEGAHAPLADFFEDLVTADEAGRRSCRRPTRVAPARRT